MNSHWAQLAIALVVSFGIGLTGQIAYDRCHEQKAQAALETVFVEGAVGGYLGLALAEFQYADEAHARSALEDFLRFAEKTKNLPNLADRKYIDLGISSVLLRLAILDQQVGRTRESQDELSRARDALAKAGRTYPINDSLLLKIAAQRKCGVHICAAQSGANVGNAK